MGRSAEESYQCDAISSMMQLNKSHFTGMHTFRLEVSPYHKIISILLSHLKKLMHVSIVFQ